MRLAYRVELVEDSPAEPAELVAFRIALVLDADVAGKRRGDGVKRGGTDRDTNHSADMGAGRETRQKVQKSPARVGDTEAGQVGALRAGGR
jgi:hypothetical protein